MSPVSRGRRCKSRGLFFTVVEWLVSVGLKLGLLVFVLTIGYFVHGILSGGVKEFLSLTSADQQRIISNALIASKAAQISAVVAVASIVVIFYSEDIVGYLLAIGGAAGYFIGPSGFLSILGESGARNNPLASIVLNTFQAVSLIMFVPGVGLTVRTVVLGVLEGLIGDTPQKSVGALMWGVEEKAPEQRNVLYPKCWEMPYCRPFIKQICPAWKRKRPCWRIKAGCYCDEETILKALNITEQRGQAVSGYRAPARSSLSGKAKRARCRTCPIYLLHQRKKYQILSPLVFPLVGMIIWVYFRQITDWMGRGLEATNHFMKYISLAPTSTGTTAVIMDSSDQIVIVLFVCWLAIISISYILRGMEYCIFKLQI